MEDVIEELSKYLTGWKGYFRWAQTSTTFRDLDSWIRRRLRSLHWKQWKVYKKRKEELIRRGVDEELAHTSAWSPKGCWKMAHWKTIRMALSSSYFDQIGLPRLER